MRVLQLIDSLNPGGAERMAVNLANGLTRVGVTSYMCTTREEGDLKLQLTTEVSYIHLRKLKTLDLSALLRLRRFVRNEGITHIHAHSTSYFLASLLKISSPRLTLIWHEHYGSRIESRKWDNPALYFCSFLFSAVITVNNDLKKWCEDHLVTKKVFFLANFVPNFRLKQTRDNGKTIVCLANLRNPKNHKLLLKAFSLVHKKHSDWKLLCLGSQLEDSYFKDLKKIVKKDDIGSSVIFAGNKRNVNEELRNSAIGVLSSNSEGLPMSLLEYGAAGLPVVCTDVGQCKEVVNDLGKVVPPQNEEALAEALLFYIENKEERIADGLDFSAHISENYTEVSVMSKLLEIYKEASK